MIVDFAVHSPDKEDGGIPNPHIHFMKIISVPSWKNSFEWKAPSRFAFVKSGWNTTNGVFELKRLFIKIYEDNASGRLNDERYDMLSQTYETEQK